MDSPGFGGLGIVKYRDYRSLTLSQRVQFPVGRHWGYFHFLSLCQGSVYQFAESILTKYLQLGGLNN